MRYLNTPIGVFDSGVGGLSVLGAIEKYLPNENYIYFADGKNLPYGNKTKEQIIEFGKNTLGFFKSKGVHHVIMACNTSAALAYDTLKLEFEDIKIYPIIQNVAPNFSQYSKIGVMATKGTVGSHKYQASILEHNKNADVYELACSRFVEIVENKLYDEEATISYVKEKLDELLKFDVEKIILGCTHYPYLLPILERFAPSDLFIDPALIFAKNIADEIMENKTPNFKNGEKEFYTSGAATKFIENAKVFYDVKNEVKEI